MYKTAQKHILNAAKALKRQDLEAMEKEYNANITDMTNKIKELIRQAQGINDQGVLDFYKALAENAQFKGQVAETIAKTMSYKEGSNVLTQETGLAKSTGGGFSIENASHFTSKEGQWHKVNTLRKAIQKLLDIMKSADDDIKKLDDFTKAYNYINKIIKILDTLEKNESYQTKLRTKISGAPKQEGIMSHKLASAIVTNIQNVLININNVQYINRRINQYYAELEGAAIANLGLILAAKSIDDVVKIINNTQRAGSQKSQVLIPQQYVFSDTVFNEYLASNAAFKNLIKKEHLEEQVGKDGYLKIFRDYSVDNKADIVYEFGNKKNNISMKKNVNLHSKEIVNEDFGFPEISLQDSSLLLFLAGMQEPDGIAEHVLNVLAKHDDKNNEYNTVRQQANRTLLLIMLYQALTGEMQNRVGGINANIFAIKDQTGKVKFFDMGQIIEDVFNGDVFSVISSSPDIRKLELKNDKEPIIFEKGKSTKQLRWEAAKRRSQKVFFEARLQNIKIGIAKSYFYNKMK